jgi:hypothetical protein
VIALDEAVDPLSVHDGSVAVSGSDGAPLDAELSVEGGRLVIRPVATPDLLARGLVECRVRLTGAPSPRALRTTDGRLLARAESLAIRLRPRLEDEDSSPPRVLAIQGRPPAASIELRDARLELSFEGVLDPATLTPERCALYPLVGGLVLDQPVWPSVDWRCIGRRFELRLQLAPGSGPLQLNLRRAGLRGLGGRVPEPPLVVEIRPG